MDESGGIADRQTRCSGSPAGTMRGGGKPYDGRPGGRRSLYRARIGAVKEMEDEGAGSIADHGEGPGGVADVAGKELARESDIHLGNDVVVGGGLLDDAVEHRVGFG